MAQSILEILIKARDEASSVLGKVGGALTSVGGYAVAGLGLLAGAVTAAGATLISLGSDAAEMQNRFNVVFGGVGSTLANQTRTQIDAYSESVGRNKFALEGMAASLQDTFVPLGFARDQAAQMSVSATKLAVDLGSWKNVDPSDVINDIQSALVGNHITMRKYGVVLTETAVEQEALRLGISNGKGPLDAQSKAMATLSLIMAGSKDAMGDATRTAGSWANQQRALTAGITETGTAMGLDLLPPLTPVLQGFNQFLKGILPQAEVRFRAFASQLGGTIGPAALMFRDAWDRIMVAFGQSPSKMTPAQAALAAFGAILDGVVTAVKLVALGAEGLAWGVEQVSTAVKIAQGLWANLSTILSTASTNPAVVAIQALAGELIVLVHPINNARTAWKQVNDAISVAQGLWANLKTILGSTSTTPAVAAVKTLADGVFNLISPIGGVVKAWGDLKALWGRIKGPDLKSPTMDTSGIDPVYIPHSPPPLAVGLDAIGRSLQQVNGIGGLKLGGGGAALGGSGIGRLSAELEQAKFNAGRGQGAATQDAMDYMAKWRQKSDPVFQAQQRLDNAERFAPHFTAGWEKGPQPAGPAGPLSHDKVQTTLDAILGKLSDPPLPPNVKIEVDNRVLGEVVSTHQGNQARSLARHGGHAPLN